MDNGYHKAASSWETEKRVTCDEKYIEYVGHISWIYVSRTNFGCLNVSFVILTIFCDSSVHYWMKFEFQKGSV